MKPDPTSPASTSAPVEPLAPLPVRPPLRARLRAYRRLHLLALGVFLLDQLTKTWIVWQVPFNPSHSHTIGADIEIVRGFFYIIHVGNTGAAWSMFSDRSLLLALLALGTLAAIFFWRHSLGLRDRFAQVSFGLLCGGIAGNLVDRMVHEHVIDFLDFHFGSYIYPTFNVADSAIFIGVALYIWQSLRAPAATPSAAAPRDPSPTQSS